MDRTATRTTINDVARQAGVSVSTVSRALRGLDKVNPDTRARVERAAEELGFTFSKTASSLASGRSMRVAVLLPSGMDQWFNANAFEGLYEGFSGEGYDVVPYVMWSEADLDSFLRTVSGTQNVDAIIVASFLLDADRQRMLAELATPTIGINTPSVEGLDASVRIDDKAAMRGVIRLLRSLGHEAVAYVEQPVQPSPFVCSDSVRLQGFLDAVNEQGYDETQVLTIPSINRYGSADGNDEHLAISDIAAQLVGATPRPTGICVENDRCAVMLLKELRRLGWHIPEEVSLVGFDGDSLGDVVDLSTVRQDPKRLGRVAADKALRLMRGETLDEPHTILPASLLTRSTTARL
ncbi:LacI family transcriptional regulator [Bifidobacterium sp. UTCIF-37]|uniref:LacI family DNA-binding transcriptional regulator n=1 Tax=unclassified Bifidobacterium TaxID=2608897 RepID=UPI00112808DA|nr:MULTISPECIES: LacI family DNA-binding transcriptional regulator [unclassified Bifidobacterium]TPF85732.1 LacI family transcriptional regulator [Bifidobacterium sp. UTCIF-37]TPF88007.1 LacI family transcriptional regulator [Bifidobacterium sp. UTCIF-38]